MHPFPEQPTVDEKDLASEDSPETTEWYDGSYNKLIFLDLHIKDLSYQRQLFQTTSGSYPDEIRNVENVAKTLCNDFVLFLSFYSFVLIMKSFFTL